MRLQETKPLVKGTQRVKPIIVHTKILEILEKRQAADRLAHAFVFVGPDQVGKTTVASWLVSQAIEVGDREAIEAHPDVTVLRREVDAKTGKTKSRISIEQVRNLRERISMSSLAGGTKAVIIEEAGTLSNEAANALLKTLEEPSGKTLLILIATATGQLPATIESRCEIIRFGLINDEELIAGMKAHKIDVGIAAEVMKIASGRPGLALEYASDQESFNEIANERQEFAELLASTPAEKLARVAKILPKGGLAKETALTKIDFWEQELRNRMIASLDETRDSVERFARALANVRLVRQALLQNTNPQLSLENFLLKL